MEEKDNQNPIFEDKNSEISKIKMPNGDVYNLKDEELRKRIKAFLGDLDSNN